MKGLIDIHAHILPGVDDGASDFQEMRAHRSMRPPCRPHIGRGYGV